MMIDFIKRKANSFFARMEEYWNTPFFNVVKTVYFNFRVLPFRQAIKLPIYIYGPTRLLNLRGSVEIKAPIRPGMIKMGRWYDRFYGPRSSSFIFLPDKSKIIFRGSSEIGIDYGIRLGDSGILDIGEMAVFTSGVKISANKMVKIGDYSRITWNCRIVDTDFHFTWNTDTKEVRNNTKPIVIGKYNWIGNNSAINKGTRTPDFTIVASGSVINKDYYHLNEDVDQPLLLAGSPAKIVGKNMRRLYSREFEAKITEHFNSSKDVSIVR